MKRLGKSQEEKRILVIEVINDIFDWFAIPGHPTRQMEIHKVMLVKIFCTKHDLLTELSPSRFIQIFCENRDLNVC